VTRRAAHRPTPRATSSRPRLPGPSSEFEHALQAGPFDAASCTRTFTSRDRRCRPITWVPRIAIGMTRELPKAHLRRRRDRLARCRSAISLPRNRSALRGTREGGRPARRATLRGRASRARGPARTPGRSQAALAPHARRSPRTCASTWLPEEIPRSRRRRVRASGAARGRDDGAHFHGGGRGGSGE